MTTDTIHRVTTVKFSFLIGSQRDKKENNYVPHFYFITVYWQELLTEKQHLLKFLVQKMYQIFITKIIMGGFCREK